MASDFSFDLNDDMAEAAAAYDAEIADVSEYDLNFAYEDGYESENYNQHQTPSSTEAAQQTGNQHETEESNQTQEPTGNQQHQESNNNNQQEPINQQGNEVHHQLRRLSSGARLKILIWIH